MDNKISIKKPFFVEKIKKLFMIQDFSELDSLEETLIEADIDPFIVDGLIRDLKSRKINSYTEAISFLKNFFISELSAAEEKFVYPLPSVILLTGVNGSGKTTTAAKIAYLFKKSGKKVLFIAGDTFRAAAIEQLEEWAVRAGVEIIKGREGDDPSSVIYDGLSHTKKVNYDIIIIDTAGRIHTRHNLMMEIGKIKKTILKFIDEKNLVTYIVIDANIGKNSYNQAKMFNEVLKLNGLILTKLDSNSKAGAVIKIKKELELPVRYITFGEKMEDIEEFNAVNFVERLFS